MKNEETKHRERLDILEKHLGNKFYETGHLHICISDAMEEYVQDYIDDEFEKFNLDFVSNTEGVVCPRCGCNRVGLIDDKGYCLNIICQYKWAN